MKLQVMQGFWNAKVVQFPLQPTQPMQLSPNCRLPHNSLQHYGRIQGSDQSQREGGREKVPPSWQECNIHCHLADNGSGQVGQFVAPGPTPWFIQDWSSLFNAFTPRNDCGGLVGSTKYVHRLSSHVLMEIALNLMFMGMSLKAPPRVPKYKRRFTLSKVWSKSLSRQEPDC